MEINRDQIMQGFLHNLCRISDKGYQKRIWIEGAGPECHDFDEAVNDFFGNGDPILEDYKQFGITEDQYRLLKRFRNAFQVFADENDFPEEFIDTPEWTKITEMAKEVLKAFKYTIDER